MPQNDIDTSGARAWIFRKAGHRLRWYKGWNFRFALTRNDESIVSEVQIGEMTQKDVLVQNRTGTRQRNGPR
jgi:hypothetical protein